MQCLSFSNVLACRRPSKGEEDALKEALLAGDVESQQEKKSRSWLSLLATAVVYVWPGEHARQQFSCS